jgi:hypothetical protein
MAKYPNASNWSQDRLDGALIHAADFGEADEAIELMQAGANPSGYPLIMAIQARHPRVVEAMLSFGADPNQPYMESMPGGLTVTALNHAIAHRDPEVVRLLLDAGADPNASDGRGVSPLGALADPAPERTPPHSETAIRDLLRSRGAR